MGTKRIYETDSHCRRFTATVLSCREQEDGFAVVLDQTAFFPEGGGQAADRGTVDGIPLLDVQIHGDTVVHTLKTPVPEGKTVTGELDWPLRFSRMQKHTGEHIVSGLIYRLYGLDNVGFHLGQEDVTLDLNGVLSREQLDRIEELANAAVTENVPVIAEYPSPEALATMTYRQKKELSGPIRIVTVTGYDACACCAPHVDRTGEIGTIKLLDAIHYKGGTRIHLQCGADAVRDYQMRYRETASAAALLSVKQKDLSDAVHRLMSQRDELAAEVKSLRRQGALALAARMPEGTAFPGVILPTDGETAQELALSLRERGTGTVAVFFGSEAAGYSFVLIGGEELPALGKRLMESLSGRGGGNGQMIRGKINASAEQIRIFWNQIGGTMMKDE